jgi:hypothetical protein
MPIIRIRYLKDHMNRGLSWAFGFSILLSVGLAFVADYLKQFELLAIFISLAGVAFLFLGFILAVIHQLRSTYYFYGGCATVIVCLICFFFAIFVTYELSKVLFQIFW